jgi:hypothetical protein
VSGWIILALLGAVCFTIAVLVWAVIRGGAMRGAAEEEAIAAKRDAVRTAEALQDVTAGQIAAAKIRARRGPPKTPADIVRSNDGKWP